MLEDNLPVGLSPAQLASIRDSDGVVNIWEGAVRSGKTIGSLLRWLIFVANAPSGGDLLIVGRTRDTIARNILGPLMDPKLFGPLAAQTKYTLNTGRATILGRTVSIIGANDSRAEEKVRGMTAAGVYADEITTLPKAFFKRARDRMSVKGAQMFGTTNPDSPAHWFKVDYLDRINSDGDNALADWRRFKFVMDDNPSLPQSYKDQMHRELTGLWYRRFILGEWVAAEGAVYEMWDETLHVVPWKTLPQMYKLLAVGVDYGTQHATSAILLGLGVDRKLYLVDEWRYDHRDHGGVKLTDSQQSTLLTMWLRGPHLNYDTILKPEWVMVDPAADSFETQLQADGVWNTMHANNDVLYGIRTVASLLSAGKLLVSDKCRGFIKEAPGYCWDDRAAERGKDQPIKREDDSLDAGRYVVTTSETIWRSEIPLLAA